MFQTPHALTRIASWLLVAALLWAQNLGLWHRLVHPAVGAPGTCGGRAGAVRCGWGLTLPCPRAPGWSGSFQPPGRLRLPGL